MVDIVSALSVQAIGELSTDELEAAWPAYEAAFEQINRLSMQRHLMTLTEFVTVCGDPRITKYLATDGHGAFRGLSVLTNHLPAWPLVAPEFFAHHFPETYAAQEIWYLGFAYVANPRSDGRVFQALIEHMSLPARAAHGMVFMDFSAANVARLIPGIRRTVQRLDPEHTFQRYDSQEFWGFDFRQGATA